MSDLAIRVEDLAKQYRISALRADLRTLRDSLTDLVVAPFRRAGKLVRGQITAASELDETIWALRDLSFEIRRGEAVGIIGPNGSGKSTLLKLLSRITRPTRGCIDVWGRVGSLLEVGAGFHPELSGRENIHLNGAILGMTRAEMSRKFDAIVDFSEVERFLDTPVKYYSSGMYLRLAFSVAAHLEPEILLVDEVLAVGDAEFQNKCLGKMGDLVSEGRTVLFVSHQMAAINRLTERTLHLDRGRLVRAGESQQVVSEYLHQRTGEQHWSAAGAPASEAARLLAVRVRGADPGDGGAVKSSVDSREALAIEMEWEVLREGHVLSPCFELYNDRGVCVFVSSLPGSRLDRSREPGRYISALRIPGDLLAEGTYVADARLRSASRSREHFHERSAVAFRILDRRRAAAQPAPDEASRGVLSPPLDWTDRPL